MRLSEEKKQALYDAIREKIMEIRVDIKMEKPGLDRVDDMLFDMEQAIWPEIKKALNIEDR